jgi:4-hydroxy-tetrahydrodipicolinate reductase
MKIGITGCKGRVGKILIDELLTGNWKNMQLSGGTSRNPAHTDFFVTSNAEELFTKSDAIIDFTLPEATMQHAKLAAQHKKILVIGTTGLSTSQENELENAAQKTPIIYAANMSLGVNLLAALVEQAAKALSPDGWDIEVFESHHHNKIDAPSGTALLLGKAAAKGRETQLPTTIPSDRNGKRQEGEIGFSVARGGDVVGEHTVFFFGQGERIELTHRATNRALFARGALKAAEWAKGKPAGLYSMRDVLGLK